MMAQYIIVKTLTRMWIVDPVDGTTNLIHHYRQSVVSVALASEGEIVLGIIYHPYTEELYCAEAGKGAYKNGVPIHVSPVKELSHSLIAVGTSPYYHEYAADNFAGKREWPCAYPPP